MTTFFSKIRLSTKYAQFGKILKRISFVLIGFLGVLLIFIIGLRVYFTQNKESIVAKITEELNKNISGTIHIGEVSYQFLSSFPDFTVVLNNVELRDNQFAIHKRSAVNAKVLEVQLNLFSLLKKNIVIKKVILIDAKVDLFTAENGVSNETIFKPNPEIAPVKSKPEIHQIDCRNVVFLYHHFAQKKAFHFEVNTLKCTINYTANGWETDVFVDVFAKGMAFNTSLGSYIKDKVVKGSFAVQYDRNKSKIEATAKKLLIGSDIFDIKSFFMLDKYHPMMNININTDILWSNAIPLLDETLCKTLSNYNISEPIRVDCSIKGDMNDLRDPEVVVLVAQIKDRVVQTPDGAVKNCSFSGKFTNHLKQGLGNNDANSAIILTHFSGVYKEIPVEMPIVMINNFKKPIASGNLKSKFDVVKLKNILGNKLIEFYGGKANIDLKFNVDIIALKIQRPAFSGTIAIEKAHLLYKPKNLLFNTDLQFVLTNKALIINKLKYQNNKDIVFVDGKIDNFLNLYYNNPEKIVMLLNINCENLDAKKFLGVLTYEENEDSENEPRHSRAKAEKTRELLKKMQVVIDLKIKKMNYGSLKAKNVRFDILMNNSQLIIKNGFIETSDGNIAIAAQLIPEKKHYNVSSNVTINRVDMSQFLTSFNNFGIQSFQPSTVKGNLSATADLKGKITAEGDLIDESMQGSLQYRIKNGSLINFEPIMNIGRLAFPFRNMKHILFNDLSGKVNLSGNFVNIDYCRVNSSVINLDVKGIYSFKKGTNLGLTIPLRNPKNDIDIEDKAEREQKRDKGIVLHLLVVDGKEDKVKIKFGKLALQE